MQTRPLVRFQAFFFVFLLLFSTAVLAQDLDKLIEEAQPKTSDVEQVKPSDSTVGDGTAPLVAPTGNPQIDHILKEINRIQMLLQSVLKVMSPITSPINANLMDAWEEQIFRLIESLVKLTETDDPSAVTIVPPITPVTPPPDPKTPDTPGTPNTPDPVKPVPSGEGLAKRGQEIIAKLRELGAHPGVGRGDSPANRNITGFPDWFCELQDLLCGRTVWTDLEEEGRNLLTAFANEWSKANIPQPMLHSLPYFFKYIGCTESNDAHIKEYNPNLMRSGLMGGSENASNWCAGASNMAYTQPIIDAGFSLRGGNNWANNGSYVKTHAIAYYKGSIEPGDYVTTASHALTILKVQGDKAIVISGNAGGGAIPYAGTIRIEEMSLSALSIVKKLSALSLNDIKAHENDAAWLRSHGITKKK